MSNRQQRRAIMRSQTQRNRELIASYTQAERVAGLIRNGLTEKDLEEAYEKGRLEGFKSASWPIIKSCYAGILLALHEEFGFGKQRCYRAIEAVDEKVQWALCNQDLIDEVFEKIGIELDFGDPMKRVKQSE